METNKISVLIVDDHHMVIEGLKTLLGKQNSIHISNCFKTAHEALKFLASNKVDVVLLDINLPDMNGVDVCRIITEEYPFAKVIGLSTYNEHSIINQMIKNGVKGYMLKNASTSELVESIERVHNGQVYFSGEVQKTIADSVAQNNEDIPVLTRREKQILEMIADGKTMHETGDLLFISPSTVETHRRNIMKKMNVPNSAALVKMAIEKGIISV
jgi:DNA-binding NarL/FixJ family response regulator